MAAPSLSSLFQVGVDILKTTLTSTKLILAQVGDVISQTVESDGAELWQQVGFVSRPSEASPGNSACQGIMIERGDRNVIIATRDTRGATLSGSLNPGESCVYAPGTNGDGQARVLLKANGSVSMYTTEGNTTSGQSMVVTLNAETGAIQIANQYGGITIDENGVQIVSAGGAGLQLTSDGTANLVGNASQINAGNVAIGPGPVFQTALIGASGPAGVASTSVKLSFP